VSVLKQIKSQRQSIDRDENSLAIAKLKKRRADTRRKIELGGLLIKSGMDGFNKSTILGALDYVQKLIMKDEANKTLFEFKGDNLFLGEGYD
jgi:hypothetical protein